MRFRKTLFFILAVCGFALAGSYFAAMFLSGDHVATETVFSNHGTMTTAAASKIRHDPGAYKPVRISLTPDMNSLSLSMIIEKARGGRAAQSDYTVTVENSDGEILVSAPCRAKSKSSSSSESAQSIHSYRSVARFTVSRTDNYVLQVVPQERQDIRILSLQLQLRRNTLALPVWVLVCGIAAAFIGISGCIISIVAASRSSSAAPEHSG